MHILINLLILGAIILAAITLAGAVFQAGIFILAAIVVGITKGVKAVINRLKAS